MLILCYWIFFLVKNGKYIYFCLIFFITSKTFHCLFRCSFVWVCKFRLPETHPALESSADLSAGTAKVASSQAKSWGKLTRKLVFNLPSNLFISYQLSDQKRKYKMEELGTNRQVYVYTFVCSHFWIHSLKFGMCF